MANGKEASVSVDASPLVVAGPDLSDLQTPPNYRGFVESFEDGVISGWCVATDDPMRPVDLDLFIGPVKVAEFSAKAPRPDVAATIGLPIRPGFRAELEFRHNQNLDEVLDLLDTLAEDEAADLLTVRVRGAKVALAFDDDFKLNPQDLASLFTKPYVIPGNLDNFEDAPGLRGLVDSQSEGAISGWCVDPKRPGEPLQLEIRYKDAVIGVTSNRRVRDDISKVLGAPGTSGFRFGPDDLGTPALAEFVGYLAKAIDAPSSFKSELSVKVAGTNCFLPIAAAVNFTEADLRRLYDTASSKLGEVSRNKRIRVARQLAVAPTNIASKPKDEVQIVAFYLPQFHPFAENDEWWGSGFTEWTNVANAKPYFRDHNQPRIPADLGYYDLRLDQVHESQIELARQHNVSAFCYYYYSFSGTTLMTMPVDRHLEKNYDLDFCLCWANENWSRRWDGSESDILMRQNHSELDDDRFIDEVIKYFVSERYIKIDGAPLLLVYRISLLATPPSTIASWKRKVKAAGFPDLHVSICETFGLDDPASFGADSSCQFPPHGLSAAETNNKVQDLDSGFTGKLYDYLEVAANEAWRPPAPHMQFRCAMPSWDNTSRRGKTGNVFYNASPQIFEAWLSLLCAKAKREQPPGKRLVFVNAWNEWGEGAYLEPDRRDGHRNLKAVRAALSASNLVLGDALISAQAGDAGSVEIVQLVSHLARVNRQLLLFATDYCGSPSAGPSPFVATPSGSLRQESVEGANCNVDLINGAALLGGEITVNQSSKVSISGWFRVPNVQLTRTLPTFLHLNGPGEHNYIASIYERLARADVATYYEDTGDQMHGFKCVADFAGVRPGVYRLNFLIGSVTQLNAAYVIPAKITFIVG